MLRLEPLSRDEKMRRVEQIGRSPRSNRLDPRPAWHYDDREAAASEQFERFPMLRRHLLIDQQWHPCNVQPPQRAQELQQPFDHPTPERHGVKPHNRPRLLTFNRVRPPLT